VKEGVAVLGFGPIFARELLTTPRRPRHFVLRTTYVGLFFVLMWTAWQAIVGFQAVQRAGDYPHFHAILFPLLARVQLVLVLFISALYGTSSLSHEKDRRTLLLLLLTRLKDREIIVEKFLCGLLQVSTMLVAALPAFALLGLLGGVSPSQIAQAYAVAFGAALLSNAIGVVIAAWREKTFQAVALTLMAVILGQLLVEVAVGAAGKETLVGGVRLEQVAAWLSPFRAMETVVEPGWAANSSAWIAQAPAAFVFLGGALVLATILLTFASLRLRSWYPTGEAVMTREPDEAEVRAATAVAQLKRGKSREVVGNPILWRETRTRGYGTRPILIKLGYFLICGIVLAMGWSSTFGKPPVRPVLNEDGEEIVVQEPRARKSQAADLALTSMVVAAAVLGLLLINTQGVTAITSERDLKALDLLLVTRITPPEFIFGKILGILFNTMEMVLAPLLLLIAAWAWGLVGGAGLFYSVTIFLVFVAFGSLLGIHAALRYDSTRVAIAHSLGTMFLLFVGILICLFLILVSGNDRFGAQWASFLLFIVLGSIGLWVSLSANAPSNALALTAALLPFATFYCVVAFLVGDRAGPFLVSAGVYGFAVAALLIPLLAEFDVATGRTTHAEG
jgi:ABC-type transport system involved in multi-copper enzyme maturation permease subunit